MADVIYRQAAIDTLERKKDKNAKGDIGGFYNKIIQNDIDALMQLPSAQPEIIRCKDRKHNSLAREILAELTGMTVNDTTNQLTERLIFGRDRDPQSKFNLNRKSGNACCNLGIELYQLDDYCSHGERREDADKGHEG